LAYKSPESAESLSSGRRGVNAERLLKISLLDIYGFEDMNPEGLNGFEQLCINYANEMLQDIFREQFLTDEMTLYKDEGIKTVITQSTQENHGLTEAFIDRHIGIWALLNQQSEVTTSRLASHVTSNPDRIFCDLVNDRTSKEYPNVVLNFGRTRNSLIINHYSGDVNYSVEGFVDRNQDVFLTKEVIEVLRFKSFCGFENHRAVRTMKGVIAQVSGQLEQLNGCGPSRFTSNASLFLNQLAKLKDELNNTNKWFIRCVKPNKIQSPEYFDDELVAEQLVSGGLLQVLDIMKNGYPCRIQYKLLYERCQPYLGGKQLIPKDFAGLVQKYFQIPDEDCQLGATQIFLRLNGWKYFEQIQSMNEAETEHFSSAIAKLQAGRTIVILFLTLLRRRVATISNGWRKYKAIKGLNMIRKFTIHRLVPTMRIFTILETNVPRYLQSCATFTFQQLYEHYCYVKLNEKKIKAAKALEKAEEQERCAKEKEDAARLIEEAASLRYQKALEMKKQYDDAEAENVIRAKSTTKENDELLDKNRFHEVWAAELDRKEKELLRREEAAKELLERADEKIRLAAEHERVNEEKEQFIDIKYQETVKLIERSDSGQESKNTEADPSSVIVIGDDIADQQDDYGSSSIPPPFTDRGTTNVTDNNAEYESGRSSELLLTNQLEVFNEGFARPAKSRVSHGVNSSPINAMNTCSPYTMRSNAGGSAASTGCDSIRNQKATRTPGGTLGHDLGYHTSMRANRYRAKKIGPIREGGGMSENTPSCRTPEQKSDFSFGSNNPESIRPKDVGSQMIFQNDHFLTPSSRMADYISSSEDAERRCEPGISNKRNPTTEGVVTDQSTKKQKQK